MEGTGPWHEVSTEIRGDEADVSEGEIPEQKVEEAAVAEEPPVRLRCVDRTHSAGCTWCTRAPDEADESEYELVGDPGKKNGEKRLRSLLTHTPEWDDVDERYRVADICDSVDQGLLASVLRRKGCSSLRKAHLIFLARTWGYQSELWCRRSERRAHLQRTEPCRAERLGAADAPYSGGPTKYAPPRPRPALAQYPLGRGGSGGLKRPRAPSGSKPSHSDWDEPHGDFPSFHVGRQDDQRQELAVQPRMGAARSTAGGIRAWAVDMRLSPPHSPAEEREPMVAIESNISLSLRPLAEQSNALLRGSEEGDSRSGAMSQREQLAPALKAVADWLSVRAREFHRALLGLRARSADLDDKQRGSVAWLQLLGAECPLEVEMLKLQEGLHRMTVEMVAAGDDVVQGALVGLELIAHCQSLVMQTKFVTYGTYCKVTIILKELMSDYTFRITDSLRARAERLSDPLPGSLGAFLQMPLGGGTTMPPAATRGPSNSVESMQRMAQVFGLLGDGDGAADASAWADAWFPHAPDVVGAAVMQTTDDAGGLKHLPRSDSGGLGELQTMATFLHSTPPHL